MADVPAITIVENRFKAMIETIAGFIVTIDQPDAEPLTIEALGGKSWINIRIPRVDFAVVEDGQNGVANLGTICFDVQSGNGEDAGETINRANQLAIAKILRLLNTDNNWTLGGRIYLFIEGSASGSEQDGADVGSAILESQAHWFTPRDNPFVIVGSTGEQFTD